MKLDKEETEIIATYESGQIKTRRPSKEELAHVSAVAGNTFRKDKKITIRLYEHDLKGIQKKALEWGMPYQTLISSMIYRFVEGNLVERR